MRFVSFCSRVRLIDHQGGLAIPLCSPRNTSLSKPSLAMSPKNGAEKGYLYALELLQGVVVTACLSHLDKLPPSAGPELHVVGTTFKGRGRIATPEQSVRGGR